jgi:Na+-transporting NADH:ubiquinone oxidoreductase subunit C
VSSENSPDKQVQAQGWIDRLRTMPNETPQKMLIVAVSLCLVCSILVASAAVLLKPLQERNKALDMKKNILAAAGLLEEGKDIDELFKKVEPRVIDFETGRYVESIDASTYDLRTAAKDPEHSVLIPTAKDIARIGRRPKYGLIYLVRGPEGDLKYIILPVHGKGLWSTMYGFVALEGDTNTIAGITFYEQGETAGLGAEVANPQWGNKWRGKLVYEDGSPEIQVVKRPVGPDDPKYRYEVEGIAGATLTSQGVTNLLHYWMGEEGYLPYLNRIRSRQVAGISSQGG